MPAMVQRRGHHDVTIEACQCVMAGSSLKSRVTILLWFVVVANAQDEEEDQ